MRCSGWGPFLGDEASGYWIGLKLLNLFTKMSDGRIEKTKIYDMVKEKLSMEDDFEIFDITDNMRRDEIAALARILHQALNENDPYALDILDQVTDEIAMVIDAITKNLNFDGVVDVSFSGGVTNIGDPLYEEIKTKIKSNVSIVKPYTSPVDGSVILAKEIYAGNLKFE